MAKKAYIGVGEQYTVLEYIESSGTQYIDTGFNPNHDTRTVADAEFTNIGDGKYIFGARAAWQNAMFAVYGEADGTQFTYGHGTQTGKASGTVISRHVFDLNKNSLYIDGALGGTLSANSFQSACSLYLFSCNQNGSPLNYTQHLKIYSCQVYDNGTLVRDFVPCKNGSGVAGLYDRVNGKFYGNAGTGAFAVGGTTGEVIKEPGVAKKIKKGYIGVDGVARKIKKAYIGIGGVARPCWSGGELAYYGTITALSVQRYHLAAASNSKYAIFGGGGYNASSNVRPEVDAYNSSLTKTAATSLSTKRRTLAAAMINDRVLFGGGTTAGGVSSATGVVDAYDSSLTKQQLTGLSAARMRPGATSVGNYALFAGGHGSSGHVTNVDAYNSSLTRSSATALSAARSLVVGVSTANHALFIGGEEEATVEAYSTSLTRTTQTSLPANTVYGAGASMSGRAIFAGGRTGPEATASYSIHDKVYVYDPGLTRTTLASLSAPKYGVSGAANDEFALFAGGFSTESGVSTVTDVYDSSLTKTVAAGRLSAARGYMAGAVIGNYFIFAGGYMNSSSTAADAYVVA